MVTDNADGAQGYGDLGVIFTARTAMREWLADPATPRRGVWLVIGKRGGPATLSAAEALEEALCHGWIDGQMRRIDEVAYLKYFAPRRRGSVWSARNRSLVDQLVARGLMTQSGLDVVETAKADGSWDRPAATAPNEPQITDLGALVSGHEPAYTNWQAMPPSVRRTYTAFYLDAKTEPTRVRRLEKILARLDNNLRPM